MSVRLPADYVMICTAGQYSLPVPNVLTTLAESLSNTERDIPTKRTPTTEIWVLRMGSQIWVRFLRTAWA